MRSLLPLWDRPEATRRLAALVGLILEGDRVLLYEGGGVLGGEARAATASFELHLDRADDRRRRRHL